MTVASLRERKKDRTRRVLMETARRLFIEQSYEATTLEQIAAESEVAVATLQRYFDSKARLVLDPWYRSVEHLREMLRDSHRPEATVVFRHFMEAEVGRYRADAGAVGLGVGRLIHGVGELVAKRLALHQEMEDLLAEALSRDAGTNPSLDLYAQMFAATLIGTTRAAYKQWVDDGGKGDLGTLCLKVVDFVLEGFPDRRHWGAARRHPRQVPV